MIRSKDLNMEIKKMELAIDDKTKPDEVKLMKAVVKGITLMLKVVRDMKSNQVATMRKMGVDLMKPTIRGDRAEDTIKKAE